jgi:glycosyltransferase involved in cell wall biosynthesis
MTDRHPGPAISIITACYNSTPYLDRLYESLKQQTYRRFEWVCVDDCSTDGTLERLLSFDVPGELGMQLYRLPINTGGGPALGVGVERARYGVIVFVDHDDELVPSALQTIASAWPIAAADKDACGMLFRTAESATGVIGGELVQGSRITTSWLTNARPDLSDPTLVYKRELLAQYANSETMNEVALGSVLLNRLSRAHPFIVGPPIPIRIYHHDNPQSQSAAVRVSERLVGTYAILLDEYDRSYLRALPRWFRHGLTLLRLSKDVHGSMWAGVDLITHRWLQICLIVLMPLAALARALKPRPWVVDYPSITPEMVHSLAELRTGSEKG